MNSTEISPSPPFLFREYSSSPPPLTLNVVELFQKTVNDAIRNPEDSYINASEIHDPKAIHAAFNQIFRSLLNDEQAARLLEPLLEHPNLPESDKQKFISHSELIEHVDAEVLFNLLQSQTKPDQKILKKIAGNIRQGPGYEKFVKYCWDRNFGSVLQTMAARMGYRAYFAGIAGRLLENESNTDLSKKKDVIISLLGYTGIYFLKTLLNYLIKTPRTEDNREALAEIEKAFFEDGILPRELLRIDILASKPNLIYFLNYCWDRSSEIDDGGKLVSEICEAMCAIEPLWIDQFVTAKMQNGITPRFFSDSLLGTLDALKSETTDTIFEALDQLLDYNASTTTGERTYLYGFASSARLKNIHAWKYKYSTEVRNFRTLGKGSQEGKDGDVQVETAAKLIDQLNQRAPSSVKFDPTLMPTHLTGGTCSAMTFSVLKNYREQRKTFSPQDAIHNIAPHFKTSKEEFRATQAAYNTITRAENSDDFKKDKMEALLRLENPELSISRTTAALDLYKPESAEDLEYLYDTLPEGQYIVRSLRPLANHFTTDYKRKEEMYGHTTLLIKEGGQNFYYDPGIGFFELNHKEQLGLFLHWQQNRWNIYNARFYKVDA